MTAQTSNTQLKRLQVIQNKALRFIYNIHYEDHITNEALHHRSKLATVKDRWNDLRNRTLDKLNLLINEEEDGNVIYKYSDYIIEDEPFNDRTHKLRDVYMRLGLLDGHNNLT